MSGIMCAMPNTGASNSTNSFTVTVGSGFDGTYSYDGYRSTPSPVIGSVSPSPAAVTVFAGAVMLDCYYLYDSFSAFYEIGLNIQGNQTGATWTSITIAGNTFTKASLSNTTYVSGSNTTTFEWYTPGLDPFSGASTVSVVFA